MREVNRTLPAGKRIRVIDVNPPIYWQALRMRGEYDLFQEPTIRSGRLTDAQIHRPGPGHAWRRRWGRTSNRPGMA